MEIRLILYIIVTFILDIALAESCTRVLWSTNGQAIIGGRTMDWNDSTDPEIWIFPRGLDHHGGPQEYAAKWTSRYGSLVVSAYGEVIVDGINEAGLAAHALYLSETDYGNQNAMTSTIDSGQWLQYILDHYGTVNEAVDDAQNLHIILSESKGHKATLHIALEDSSGDSAIIEYLNGRPHIYHGKEYTILTNAPPYSLQLQNRNAYKRNNWELALPGGTHSLDRFVRASYYLEQLPIPQSPQEATSAIMSILRAISTPFSINSTHYRTLTDITNGRFYFDYTRSNNMIWIDLSRIDFTEKGKVMSLNPQDPDLVGECNGKFVEISHIKKVQRPS